MIFTEEDKSGEFSRKQNGTQQSFFYQSSLQSDAR